MRMIVEKNSHGTYVYFENEKQFKRNEKIRRNKLTRLSRENFDNECNLNKYGAFYITRKVKR